jgi:hypothetical protein
MNAFSESALSVLRARFKVAQAIRSAAKLSLPELNFMRG